MNNINKKQKLQQQIELANKKLRLLEHNETQKQKKARNEKLFTTGGIFDMINSELTIRKHTLQNPYTHQDNIQFHRLVGLAISFNKLIQENNIEKLDQLEKIGADYLNNREAK